MSARAPHLRRLQGKKENAMSLRPPLRVSVTRHEEKEQKLQQFLSQHIAAQRPGSDAARPTHLLLVARSLQSPVIALGQWAMENLPDIQAARAVFDATAKAS